MTATEAVAKVKAKAGNGRLRWPHYLMIAAGLLVLLSFVRTLDDANDVTSSGTVNSTRAPADDAIG